MKKRFTEEHIIKVVARLRNGTKASELEHENARLKRLVADQALNIEVLKDVNSKKW